MVLASDLAVFPVIVRARLRRRLHRRRTSSSCPTRPRWRRRSTTLRGPVQGRRAAAQLRHHDERRPGDLDAAGSRGLHRAAVRALRAAQPPGPVEVSRASIKAIEFPISAALKGKMPMASVRRVLGDVHSAQRARTRTSPGASSRTMSSKAVTLGAARNGNGPVRVSTYADPSFAAAQPLAADRGQGAGDAPAFRCPPSPKRRARRRSSWRRCSSRCSAARRRRTRSPRSSSGSSR